LWGDTACAAPRRCVSGLPFGCSGRITGEPEVAGEESTDALRATLSFAALHTSTKIQMNKHGYFLVMWGASGLTFFPVARVNAAPSARTDPFAARLPVTHREGPDPLRATIGVADRRSAQLSNLVVNAWPSG